MDSIIDSPLYNIIVTVKVLNWSCKECECLELKKWSKTKTNFQKWFLNL